MKDRDIKNKRIAIEYDVREMTIKRDWLVESSDSKQALDFVVEYYYLAQRWWLVADDWCWFILREKYCWLIAGGWFVLREKYCRLVADKPNEQGG
jgi:hypothetical protein